MKSTTELSPQQHACPWATSSKIMKMKTRRRKQSRISPFFKNYWNYCLDMRLRPIEKIPQIVPRRSFNSKHWMQSRRTSNVPVQWNSHPRWADKYLNKYFGSIPKFVSKMYKRITCLATQIKINIIESKWSLVLSFETSWTNMSSARLRDTMYFQRTF